MAEVKRIKIVVEGDDSDIKKMEDSLESGEKKARSFGDTAKVAIGTFAGQLMERAVDAVSDFVKSGVEGFGELQQKVANISTIKPTIDTSAVFDSLNMMTTRIPQTAAELGDALYDVFSSVEVTQKEGLQLVEQFGKGALGAQTDAKSFGTSIMGVMNAYKLSVSDAQHISDLFFTTVNKGVVSGAELASSLGPVTQAAKSAGQSTNTLFAAIAAVTKEGGPAAQNINNLNNVFQKLTTDKAVEGFKSLGIEVSQNGKFRDLASVLTDLKAKLDPLPEAVRAAKLNEIFPDAQARQGIQTLLSQLDFLKETIKDNGQAAGATEAAYEKMSGTFQSQSKLLQNSLSAIGIALASEVLPKLTPFISALAKDIPGAINQVGPSLRQVGQWFANTFSPIMPMVRDVAAFFVQQFGVVVGWFRENMPLIQATIQTVLAVIASLWERYGRDIKTIVSALLSAVLNAVKLAMQILTGDWRGAGQTILAILNNLWTAIKSIFNGIVLTIRGVGESIYNAAKDIGNSIWQGITGGMDAGKGRVAQAASGLANTATNSAQTSLDSHSPSRVFMDIGRDVVDGFILGISMRSPALGIAITQMVTDSVNEAVAAYEKAIAATEEKVKAVRRQLWVAMYGENSAAVLRFDNPDLPPDQARFYEGEIARLNGEIANVERRKAGQRLREGLGNSWADTWGNPFSSSFLTDFMPRPNTTLATSGFGLDGGIVGNRQNAGPRGVLPPGAGRALTDGDRARQLMAPFISAIEQSAQASGGRILDSLLGGNRRGNVLRSLWDEMANMGRDALGTLLGNELRRGMVGLMREVGGILTGQVNTLRVSTSQILSVVSSAYALIAASQRKRQFGFGSILGGVGGFLLGGPAGAIAGYNVGNALDNGDYTGALIGAATGYAAGSFTKAGAGTATRAVNVNQTIYGGIHNATDLDRVQTGLAASIRGEMLSTQ